MKFTSVLIGGCALMLLLVGPESGWAGKPVFLSVPANPKVRLDRDVYAAGDNIFVTVTDPARNTDPKRIESIKVTASVLGGGDSESLRLTETGPDTGEFVSGKWLALASRASDSGDGRIQATGGQVIEVRYADGRGREPADQAIVKGGYFRYTVDHGLRAASGAAAGDPSRPIAVVINPGGWRDEFVANEVIIKADDPAWVRKFLQRYDGEVLHDGSIAGSRTSSRFGPHFEKKFPYMLIRVNTEKANMRNLEQRLTEYGLRGEFVLSSRQSLQLAAIILEQRSEQRNVSLNTTMRLARCPRQQSIEGAGLDAFDYAWIRHDYFRVHRAWQFLDGLGLPEQTLTGAAGSPWVTHWQRTSGSHPAWGPVRLGIMDVNFAPDTDWPYANILDYDCYSQSYTPVLGYLSVSLWCGGRDVWADDPGWHGTGVYGVAAAVLSNNYGSAGIAGMFRGNLDERVYPLLSQVNEGIPHYEVALNILGLQTFGDGLDVLNMSFGGECNWWCQTFSGLRVAGTDALYDALRAARDRGTIVVASAGNDELDLGHEYWWGPRLVLPCEGPGVVCVGAVEQSSGDFTAVRQGLFPATRIWGSNYGVGVDIWAPTELLVSRPQAIDHSFPPLAFVPSIFGGTSAAAPYVAGTLAMVKALYPVDRRGDFDATAAHALMSDTATRLGADGRVDDHGGLINPFEVVRTQASRLGIDIAAVDMNEPNDNRADSSPLIPGQNVQGIAAPNDDADWFRFRSEDYFDLTADIATATNRGHVRIGLYNPARTLVASAAPPIAAALEPGVYYLSVEDDRSGGYDFNCYQMNTALTLTPIEADVFDDGDASTPSPGPWPTERNDDVWHRTELQLGQDPAEHTSRIGYDDLNFDRINDADYFSVRLPEDANEACLCPPDSFGTSSSLTITIDGGQAVQIRVYVRTEGPHGLETWEPIDPYAEDWVHGWGSYRVLELPCPDQITATRQDGTEIAVLTDDRELIVSLEAEAGRTDYDLDIEYIYRSCNGSGVGGTGSGGFYWPEPEEHPALFPRSEFRAFWDCLSDPACDPAEEAVAYYVTQWPGGDFKLFVRYASPRAQGTVNVTLIDAAGDTVASTKTAAIAAKRLPEPPSGTALHGVVTLSAKDLSKGWYTLRVKAPAPASLYYGERQPWQ